MARFLSLCLGTLCLAETALSVFNEAKCAGRQGQCQDDGSACNRGTYLDRHCPTQASTVRCCVEYEKINEDPCKGRGGQCQDDGDACAGEYVSSQCPSLPGNIRCCLPPAVYNEAPCSTNGGECQIDSTACAGNYVSRQCPTQGGDVRCCLPSAPTVTSPAARITSCGDIPGGVCMNFFSCPGISASRLCPGSSAQKCCFTPQGHDVIDEHLSKEEGGLFLTGYIPTAGSGVTIATGVDLGQQSATGLRNLGVSQTLINKFSPYLGLKKRVSVTNAGLDPANLAITLQEGLQLNEIFKADLLRRISSHSSKLSNRGKAVLASLSHWCYLAIRTSTDDKCHINGCTNYIRNAFPVGGGPGTDAALKSALVSLRACADTRGRPDWLLNRLRREAEFI